LIGSDQLARLNFSVEKADKLLVQKKKDIYSIKGLLLLTRFIPGNAHVEGLSI
jgi:hypothetical protein